LSEEEELEAEIAALMAKIDAIMVSLGLDPNRDYAQDA
jgi:hypothetical protein